ncbi:hypothetical protein V8C42DRAFT_306196 [Trichoderma barbatum]
MKYILSLLQALCAVDASMCFESIEGEGSRAVLPEMCIETRTFLTLTIGDPNAGKSSLEKYYGVDTCICLVLKFPSPYPSFFPSFRRWDKI